MCVCLCVCDFLTISYNFKEWAPIFEGASDMDIDRSFFKELHSLKDKVSDSMLISMVNQGSETIKNKTDLPKNFS